MRREPLLFAFHDGTVYTFERTDRHSASVFGGPLELKITGQPFGPKPLHHIACLRSWHLPVLGTRFVFSLPLIFGMQFDGCELSYRLVNANEIEVLRIKPAESLEDWPYPNYPPLLPYVPLRLDDTPQRESYDSFAQRFPNMPWPQPTELVVAVPPPATIGMSLWGPGDGDDVTIVFECDLEKQQIRSYSLTS
jgi:hypothetical protein